MDPNAKDMKAAKRRLRALGLIRQGLQLNQWSIAQVEEGTEIYIIGKPEMVPYVKELINETTRQESPGFGPTSLFEFGASSTNDSEASHAEVPLSEEPTSKNKARSESEIKKDSGKGGEAA